MKLDRRQTLLGVLFGAGGLGLRSLATGLPISFLANPLKAMAAEAETCTATYGQFLVLSTSGSGDPLNANVPGTYLFPQIAHSPSPTMARTAMTLSGTRWDAAKPWADLPQNLLDRSVFFHHTTLTNNHANQNKVMKLMGATNRQEMFASIYAKNLAKCLGTVQSEPVVVGASGSGELLSYQGRTLPKLSPSGLRDTLTSAAGPLTTFQQIRDNDLNRLNALLKESGTPIQRAFLDRMAQTQTEARSIAQDLLADLAAINGDNAANQMVAAAILVKMKVSPVISTHISFGGDNHTDNDLLGEAAQTVAGVANINALFGKLTSYGLQDAATFAAMNVFGRTLSNRGTTGRDHMANHHVTVMIGKGLKGGVVGGLEPKGNEFTAQAINSTTGAGGTGGDILFNDTLGAVGKTLGAALGVSNAVLDDNITTGKVVRAALV